MRIALIDICGTIFFSNTTSDFLDWYIHRKSYRFFRKISRTWVWRFFNKLFYLLCKIDLTRAVAFRYLKGKERRVLLEYGRYFYEEFLRFRINIDVLDKIEKLNQKGYKLFLASATLDFIAEIISGQLHIPVLCSTDLLYADSGICTGKILKDRLGHKLDAIYEKHISLPVNVVITDNFSDVDILKYSQKCFIVASERERKRWKQVLIKNQINKSTFI